MIRELTDRSRDLRWHRYWAGMVRAVASHSRCLSRKVGTVLVRDKRMIATGYNGLPSGFDHCAVCYGGERVSGHGLHRLPCVHAEQNALLQCAMHGISCRGADMYVSIMPCNDCLKSIVQAGIRRVYCLEPYFLAGEAEELRQFLLDQAYRSGEFEMILLPQVGM